MMELLERYRTLLFIFLFVVEINSKNETTTKAPKVKPLCSRCECLGTKNFIVDCDSKNLKEIPEIAEDMKSPWQFHLRSNSIERITPFPTLENLRIVYFDYNQISKIDDSAFRNLTNLKELHLSFNKLTADSIHPDTFRGPYSDKQRNPLPLEILDLSHNKLNKLPKDLFIYTKKLTKLNLSYNPFSDFSIKTAQAISELHNLKSLDLSYTKLLRLPHHFFSDLTHLSCLDISGNEFIYVPDEVNYVTSLKELVINNNLFGILPGHSFWQSLSNLETLRISHSKTLFRIEDGTFGNLTSLRTLYLTFNPQLAIIMPRAFTNTKNHTLQLRELHLENNALKSLSKEALPWNSIPVLNLQENPWNCDCDFEWLAKGVVRTMQDTGNHELTLNVICAAPSELMGQLVTSSKVQSHKFVCVEKTSRSGGYGFLVMATIIVGTLLLMTGTILFSYILFRRSKVQEWLGSNVKYRRTFNIEDEEIVTSSQTQY